MKETKKFNIEDALKVYWCVSLELERICNENAVLNVGNFSKQGYMVMVTNEKGTNYTISDIHEMAYKRAGFDYRELIPAFIKETYWYKRLNRVVSPFCIIAVQNYIESTGKAELAGSELNSFFPCRYCPYKDKREEVIYDKVRWACRPTMILTRRFHHYKETSLEDIDNTIESIANRYQISNYSESIYRLQRDLDKIFKDQIIMNGNYDVFNKSKSLIG